MTLQACKSQAHVNMYKYEKSATPKNRKREKKKTNESADEYTVSPWIQDGSFMTSGRCALLLYLRVRLWDRLGRWGHPVGHGPPSVERGECTPPLCGV